MADKNAPKKRRLFVGTFLPPEAQQLIGQLAEHNERLSAEWQRKLRWVRQEKLHLTWVFLGQVDEGRIPELKNLLDSLVSEQPPLDLTYSKPVFWPSARRARTFVVVPDPAPPAIMDLGEQIKKAMKPYAEKIEPKYRPHITLLRMESGTGAAIVVPDWFPLVKMLPLDHPINRIDLIESDLGGTRSYQSIAGWDLN